eukprot:c53122_g1_i1.p1 GENE.c53122_g1_i1~~c53122_g1_i1.p1  ORF type:complete len:296 (-),score=52.47 c53122_g1_i1:38-925(-)
MVARGFVLAATLLVLATAATANIDYILDSIYIGNQHAAADLPLLQSLNISAILNVAWDLDIRYDQQYYVDYNPDPSNAHLILQYTKVGLVDGEGNAQATLAAAVFALDQLLSPRTGLAPSDASKYPQPVRGVLLHCHSGTSRSVTVGALYLFYKHPEMFDTYSDALLYVKTKRHVQADGSVPKAPLTALANTLAPYPVLSWFPAHGNPSDSPPSPPTKVPAKAAASKGLSGGMIALVLFAVVGGLVGLYCAVGIFYNKSRGHEGTDLIPHAALWCAPCNRRDRYGAVRLPAYDFS